MELRQCNQNDTPCSDGGQCNWVCADHTVEVCEPNETLRAKVLAYKHPELVARISRVHDVSQGMAEVWFKMGLEYLYQAATTRTPISPSHPADKMWHEFLMYTRDYRAFCQEMFGFFIEHCPKPQLK